MKSYLYLSLQLFILLQKVSFSKTNKNYRNTWNVVSQEKKNFSEAMNICRLVYNGSLVEFADLNQSETQDICTNGENIKMIFFKLSGRCNVLN